MSDAIKVAVRCRPFNGREKQMNSKCIITMNGQQTIIEDPDTGKPTTFTFDYSYWSHSTDDSTYATQEMVYNDLGISVLENAWQGYNASLFAYGQTGSGKSYSMVGYGKEIGIIPRACDEIFNRINREKSDSIQFKVVASMMEIYNEQIRDLFNPKNNPPAGLKLREHPVTGPYVEDLSELTVNSYEEISALMDKGSKARTVASTNMNDTSSRAHTLFQIVLTKTTIDKERGKATDKVSKITLVDLAGSERSKDTGAKGDRLLEGCAINKSLSTLGNVIAALVKRSNAKGKKKEQVFVPYRDSKLTLIMKESLGGNARTIMISALSPASVNYEETMSTLKYANRAKQITNTAVVNEDPNEKIIAQLRAEIEQLRRMVQSGGVTTQGLSSPEMDEEARREMEKLREELEASQKIIMNMQMSTEERSKKEAQIAVDRDQVLKDAGLLEPKIKEDRPYITNLHPDKQLSQTLVFYLKEGKTTIGRKSPDYTPDIPLGGVRMQPQHCYIECVGDVTKIIPCSAQAGTFVNGTRITEATVLEHNSRIIFASNHTYMYKKTSEQPLSSDDYQQQQDHNDEFDYFYAQREFAEAQGITDIIKNPKEEEMEKKMKELEEQMRKEREDKEKAIEEQNQLLKVEQSKIIQEQQKMMEELKKKEEEIKLTAAKKQTSEIEKMKKQQNEELEKMKQMLQQQQQAAEEQLRKQQADIERQKKNLEEETLRAQHEADSLKRRKLTEEKNRSDIEEKLITTIPMVSEVNAIALELQRDIELEVKLYTYLFHAQETRTDVGVMVHDKAAKRNFLWPNEKFRNRYYLIQEMYQKFLHAQNEGKQFQIDQSEDPLWDPDEAQELSVGISILNLKPLTHMININLWIPIFNSKGERSGEMKVSLTPLTIKGTPIINEYVPDTDSLIGQNCYFRVGIESARGIPNDRCTDVMVRWKIPYIEDTEEWTCTDTVRKRTSVPEFNFFKNYSIENITKDHIRYLRDSCIKFEVMAKFNNDVLRPNTGFRIGSAGHSRPSTSGSNDGNSSNNYDIFTPNEEFANLQDKNLELALKLETVERQKQEEQDRTLQKMKHMEQEMERLRALVANK
jgi:pSer/pThr/pTyr-binding forkhead associated (FHA) protein